MNNSLINNDRGLRHNIFVLALLCFTAPSELVS